MKLQILLEKPKDKVLALIFGPTFILAVIFSAVIFPYYLNQFPKGAGLFEIKAAWSKQNIEKIFNIWRKDGSQDYFELMTIVNMIDFIFIVVYGTALTSGILLVARGLKDSEKLQNFYLKAVIFPIAAAILDVIEGIFIQIMLWNPNNVTDFHAFGSSLSNFLLLLMFYLSLLLMIIGAIICIILFAKNRKM
jgi:hypothetical protein